jgi:polysaccharide export outer membrane protein
MRSSLFVLLCASIALAGCSHLSDQPDDGWQPTLTGGPAHVAGPEGGPDARAPIIETRGGAWHDMTVTPVTDQPARAVARADGPYLLDSGDQLRIFVYGQPNLSRIYTVDHAGNVVLPLIGVVRARRKTIYSLSETIRGELGSKYVRDPQVTVDIHQNRPFFILGEVRTPGQYPYVNGMTVETAVAIAGGYSPRARERDFRISRRVDGVVEVDKGGRNYVVQPGDTIRVSERFF